MNNLWRKTCFSLCLCGITTALSFGSSSLSIAASKPENVSKSNFSANQRNMAQRKQPFCESLGAGYQEHYSFETRNYDVSICRRGSDWYYYRKSKSDPDSALLIPARSVFDDDTFKAVDGKVTYFVGINSDGYYSSVMYGNNRLIFEPELIRNSESSQSENGTTSVDYKRETEPVIPNESNNSYKLESVAPELNLSYWQICTQDPHDFHPDLDGWQRFIGNSSEQVHRYVANKGYKLVRDEELDQVILSQKSTYIETDGGLLITFGVLQLTDTVASVCVEPATSF